MIQPNEEAPGARLLKQKGSRANLIAAEHQFPQSAGVMASPIPLDIPDHSFVLQERIAQSLPAEILEIKRWLYWLYKKPDEDGKKPSKVPYWTNDLPRSGDLGASEDIASLDILANACRAFSKRRAQFCVNNQHGGVGFALIEGDKIRALDLDGCYSDGQITDPIVQKVYDQAKNDGCYIEISPSGKGLRIIGYREQASACFNRGRKYESYSEKRYVTITGDCIANARSWCCVDRAHQLFDELTREFESSSSKNKSGSKPKIDLRVKSYDRLLENDENITRVQSALDALDPDFNVDKTERDRDEWLDIIMAIHSLDWSCSEKLAREWSERGDRFSERKFDFEWRSLKVDGGITVGTLFHYAKTESGWQDPRLESSRTAHEDIVAEMNKNFAWIEEASQIFRLDHGKHLKTQNLREEYANKTVIVPSGKGQKEITFADIWMKSPNRRQHPRTVLDPCQGNITEHNELNLWKGFSKEPIRGDARPFIRLFNRLFPIKQERRYIIKWLAHLVQNPGIKMHVALVVWSAVEGVGKNLIFDCLRDIIGDYHSATIGKNEIGSQFNGWAKGKIFVIGDEVIGEDKRLDADKLKTLITGTTLQINEKFQPCVEQKNLLNFVFLSNHCNAVFMNNRDRRYYVVEVTSGVLPASDAEKFVSWRENGGLEVLLDFLQKINLTGFNPKAPAPMTVAKEQMIADNRSDLETWAESIMSAGPMNALGREIATADELANLYDQRSIPTSKTSAKTINKVFKGLGARSLGQQVPRRDGRRVRVLTLARHDHWRSEPNAVLAAELEKPLVPPAGRKGALTTQFGTDYSDFAQIEDLLKC